MFVSSDSPDGFLFPTLYSIVAVVLRVELGWGSEQRRDAQVYLCLLLRMEQGLHLIDQVAIKREIFRLVFDLAHHGLRISLVEELPHVYFHRQPDCPAAGGPVVPPSPGQQQRERSGAPWQGAHHDGPIGPLPAPKSSAVDIAPSPFAFTQTLV